MVYQDMFDVFYKAAKLANGKNKTRYDEAVNSCWREQVHGYTAGKKTREQAIADFKQKVKARLDIMVMVE
jgi:multiple sugar transport system substrate-binding protein